MQKKNLYINALPIVIWLCLFVIAFLLKIFRVEEIGNFIGLGYVFLLFAIPLFYGIYNYVITSEIKAMVILNVISLGSQLVGLAFNGSLHYSFISSDSEALLVIQAYLVITLICTVIIDFIAVLLKVLANRLRK